LIQWTFQFPDIPSGWPTLLGVSAGTTVAAVGITSTRGAKGAGPVSPSFADFITSGGMVMSTRFQFFVWTLVGGVGFLFLILRSDPSNLHALPDVPTGFLYLMGISSAGYLGGKVTSLPGPNVQQLVVSSASPAVAATPASPGVPAVAASPAKLVINLKGQNLSTNAKVKLGDKELRMLEEFTIKPLKQQDQAPDSSFCTEIELTLTTADNTYLENQHTLTITNKDGQMAVATFPLDGLTISPVNNLTQGAAQVNVTVNGTNFVDRMTAVWMNAAKVATPIPATDITKNSAIEIIVKLTPGTPGTGTLTLVSPIGLRAHVDVTVV
jgi:hypothetical protein